MSAKEAKLKYTFLFCCFFFRGEKLMTPEFRVDFTDGFNFKTDKRNLCAVIML